MIEPDSIHGRALEKLGWTYSEVDPEGHICTEKTHAGWWKDPVDGRWYCNLCESYEMPNVQDVFMHIIDKVQEGGLRIKLYSVKDTYFCEIYSGRFTGKFTAEGYEQDMYLATCSAWIALCEWREKFWKGKKDAKVS